MLAKASLFLLALLVLGADCDYFSPSFNWRSHFQADEDLDLAESREPLSPNYKDPVRRPVQAAKPSYDESVLPGGVVDVDATDGFGSAGSLPGLGSSEFAFDFGAHSPGFSRKPSAGGLFGIGSFFNGPFGDYQPWWKGQNVCIEREESTDDDNDDDGDDDENTGDGGVENKKNDTEEVPNFFATSISLSNCQQTPTKYECVTKINNHGVVKTFTVRYKCCYGYVRVDGANGCNKQLELKPLLQTIEQLDGKAFMEMVDMAGVRRDLDERNLTVFLPMNDAVEDFDDSMTALNRVEATRRRRRDAVSTLDLVRNHLADGFVDLNDLANEATIATRNHNRTVRINVYPTRSFDKMLTANCVRVTKSNNLAKNGIVHVVDGVMQPASASIRRIIDEHPKLNRLRLALQNADVERLADEDGHYTLFAPTDDAFDKLDAGARDKLLSGSGCAASILKHHIVGNTICSAAIMGNATTHNIAGEVLEMERTDDNRLLVQHTATIDKADIVATNGVIHLLDTVMIPESALHLGDALRKHNMSRFQQLVEDAHLMDEMNAFANATVFAPNDEAFGTPEAKAYLEDLAGDADKLKAFIKRHVIDGKLETCDMDNNALLDTLDADQQLRVNLYSTLPLFANIVNRATVNCARLMNYDEKACGSVIHEVDRILMPVNQTIMEMIDNGDNYSTLRKVMQGTDVEAILKDTKRSISFVAPDDEAFKTVNEEDMKTLMEDKEKAGQVLKNHILSEVLCCAGIGPQTWGFNSVVPTMTGQHHQISRSGSRQVRIGRATVTKCDQMAANGVVHTVNRVLFPQRPHHPHLGFFFFDF